MRPDSGDILFNDAGTINRLSLAAPHDGTTVLSGQVVVDFAISGDAIYFVSGGTVKRAPN